MSCGDAQYDSRAGCSTLLPNGHVASKMSRPAKIFRPRCLRSARVAAWTSYRGEGRRPKLWNTRTESREPIMREVTG